MEFTHHITGPTIGHIAHRNMTSKLLKIMIQKITTPLNINVVNHSIRIYYSITTRINKFQYTEDKLLVISLTIGGQQISL